MREWAQLFFLFGTIWILESASADLKCYIDVLNAKLTLEKLRSEHDDYSIHYNEEAESLKLQLINLQSNRTAWQAQTEKLANDNSNLNATLMALEQTYNDTKIKLTSLEQLVGNTQREISINVDKRTSIAHANEELTRSVTNLLFGTTFIVQSQMRDVQSLALSTSQALTTGLDDLKACQENVTSTSQYLTDVAFARADILASTLAAKQAIVNREIQYSTTQRQYEGLAFCDGMDMTSITGTAITPYMIRLCEILDLDEIQSCRANVTAYEHNNTVSLSQIDLLELSINNKSCSMKKFNEETKSCSYDYDNCTAFLSEKQAIMENRKAKEAGDTDESVNIYHALQAAMNIHSKDEKFKEMTRIMTKLDDRVIYSFEPDYISTLRTDLLQIYLMQSRKYLCDKLNCPCPVGHQCVLRPFYETFLGQSEAFTNLIKTILKSVNGSSARFYAKTWSIGHFSIPPFPPFQDSKIFPPDDLTKGYILLPQHIIFQSSLIDFLDPDIDLTRWLFKMNNAFGIPNPSPQERFFINAMNSTVSEIMNAPWLVDKYVKCKCISCDKVGHAEAIAIETAQIISASD